MRRRVTNRQLMLRRHLLVAGLTLGIALAAVGSDLAHNRQDTEGGADQPALVFRSDSNSTDQQIDRADRSQDDALSRGDDDRSKTATPNQPAVLQERKIYRLFNLKNRTAVHRSPDALVCLARGFDPAKPPRLIIFLHGLTNNVDDVLSIWHLDRHVDEGPANTVLILPEWAADPKAYSRQAAPFHNPGFFRRMLEEILSKVPELENVPVDSLKNIGVISYSGGFRAARSIVENNGLDNQVDELVLLDSLYVSDWFDRWLAGNADKLADGRKRYHNFYFDTANQSRDQYERLKQMFVRAGRRPSAIVNDLSRPDEIMRTVAIAEKPVIFKFSRLYTSKYSAHMNVVDLYFPRVLKAMRLRESGAAQSSISDVNAVPHTPLAAFHGPGCSGVLKFLCR